MGREATVIKENPRYHYEAMNYWSSRWDRGSSRRIHWPAVTKGGLEKRLKIKI